MTADGNPAPVYKWTTPQVLDGRLTGQTIAFIVGLALVCFALAGLLLSVFFVRETHGHARHESTLLNGTAAPAADQPSFAQILLLTSWKDRALFAASHRQGERVVRLLTAASAAAEHVGWRCVRVDVELDVTVRSPTPRPPGDATKFLGGIADVLQGRKADQGVDLSHLDQLAGFALFDDDSQVREIAYRVVVDSVPSYTVLVTLR